MTEYNPLDDMPLERTDLENAEQEIWKQSIKMRQAQMIVDECIELLKNTDNGIGVLCLNKLKKIEL